MRPTCHLLSSSRSWQCGSDPNQHLPDLEPVQRFAALGKEALLHVIEVLIVVAATLHPALRIDEFPLRSGTIQNRIQARSEVEPFFVVQVATASRGSTIPQAGLRRASSWLIPASIASSIRCCPPVPSRVR